MVERGELEMEETDIDINELMPPMDETEYVINNQTETMKERRKKMKLYQTCTILIMNIKEKRLDCSADGITSKWN